jgi:hypothetical protein
LDIKVAATIAVNLYIFYAQSQAHIMNFYQAGNIKPAHRSVAVGLI